MTTFKEWLAQTIEDEPELSKFIMILDPLFTSSGFNAKAFEQKIAASLRKIDTGIDNSLKAQTDAESQEDND